MHLLSSSRTLLLLLTTLTLPTAYASSSSSPNTTTEPLLLANLTYGNFLGSYSPEYNITYWQKIPYAAPPVGPLRFRAPQPPLPENSNGSTSIYNSTQPYDLCPQRTVNGSEDCLYLGLYSRPWTPSSCSSSSSTPLRPVVVTFHGGAFIQGGGSFTLPPSAFPILNVSSSSDEDEDAVGGKEYSPDIIFIYPNYRLNAFGFLPGKEISEDPESDLNVGLLDQRAVLQWVRDYIEVFGGDKEQVTVWGQSAGGGSVIAQVLGNGASTVEEEEEENEKEGKRREKLFQRALAGSPFWPKTYHYDAPEAQELYDRFAELAGCGSTTTTTTTTTSLQCLKQAPVQTLREASLAVSASHTYNTSSYSWAPVIDKKFLLKPLSSATSSPNLQLNINSAWTTYNLHEGENFLPQGLSNSTGDIYGFNSSLASFDQWLQGYLPGLTEIERTKVKEELYPEVGMAEELVGGYNTSYTRAGLIYRDTVLTCPGLWMVEASGGGGGGGGGQAAYLGEYTIDPAKHGSDTGYWNRVNDLQQTDRLIYEGYAGAFASFFQTGDPNAYKLTGEDQAGVPDLRETGMQFVIRNSSLVTGGTDMLRSRCDFWQSVGERIPI